MVKAKGNTHSGAGRRPRQPAIRRYERGWAGHFICAARCKFRRNTLLECGAVRIVVSTVGAMEDYSREGEFDSVGLNRYYETMAFHAMKDGCYWDADVTRRVCFEANWALEKITDTSDEEANAMHEAVVEEIAGKLSRGEKFESA